MTESAGNHKTTSALLTNLLSHALKCTSLSLSFFLFRFVYSSGDPGGDLGSERKSGYPKAEETKAFENVTY